MKRHCEAEARSRGNLFTQPILFIASDQRERGNPNLIKLNRLLHYVRNDAAIKRHCERPKEAWQSVHNIPIPTLMERGGYIYILTNKNHTVLYTGVTSNLPNRLHDHRTGLYKSSFTYKYNIKKLVYYEGFLSIEEAICREKQIKAGSRQKKLDLINRVNPEWNDLSGNFF